MKNTLKSALLASTFIAPAAAAENAAANAEIEDIVVTATRTQKPVSEIGASISVIGEEALERAQFSFVQDVFQTLPGVSVNQNGAYGGISSVSIRGAATAQTVVLIDGVQMNDVSSPGGAYNFASVDPAGIERIEVLRGPQSVLYGSDAIGGVINIITKTGGDGFAGSAFVEYGAFDTYRGGANIAGGSDQFGFNLSASGIKSDGISKAASGTEKDGIESYTLRGRVTSKLSDVVRVEFIGSYNDSEAEVDGFGPVDAEDMALSEDYLVAGRIYADIGKLQNTVSVEYSGIDRASVTSFGTYPGKGRRFNLDYLGVYSVDDHWTVTAGAQHENVKAESASEESFDINSVFGMLSYGRDGFNFSAGLRLDDHETYGSSTNAQLRASYALADTGLRFFANWGEGFKAPSVYQLTYICTFCGLTEPNTDLLPEQSDAWEVGAEQTFLEGRAKISVAYFDQKITDMIDFSFTKGYDNLDRARLKGVEAGVDFALTDALRVNANYTYTSAKDADLDQALVRRPKHKFFVGLDADVTDKIVLNASLTHNGTEVDSYDFTTGDPVNVDSWTRVDVRASYQVTDVIQLYARVDNLFDADYQQIRGYATPGISSFFGIRGSF